MNDLESLSLEQLVWSWRVVHEFDGGKNFASRQRATIFMAFRGKLMNDLDSVSRDGFNGIQTGLKAVSIMMF